MAINYNPTTVSDGLVLALDAANTRSYGGSGTTWTDISYRGNNGTLTNGPAYTTVGFNEPFGGAGGVYFDGTGDYLSLPSSNNLAVGTGDFTFETWVYPLSWTNSNAAIIRGDNNSMQIGRYGSSNNLGIAKAAVDWYINDATLPPINKWTHIAVVRSSGTLKIYIDGVSSGTTATGNTVDFGAVTVIGANTSGSDGFNGFISNAHLVKGTALYTSNFTPPRSLLTAVSGTSLLTCQKGNITDASSNNFTITVSGDARSVYGFPSFKFDGTDDYVTAPNNADFDFGSGDFTVEYWINFSTVSGIRGIFGKRVSEVNYAPILMYLQSSALQLLMSTSGSSWNVSLSTSTLSTGSWNHVAVFRSGTTVYLFLNGTSIGSTGTVSGALISNTAPLTVGVDSTSPSGSTPLNGYISNFRIYKGKALTAAEVSQNFNALRGRFGI